MEIFVAIKDVNINVQNQVNMLGTICNINYLWLPWQFSHISQLNRHHWIASRIHEIVQKSDLSLSLLLNWKVIFWTVTSCIGLKWVESFYFHKVKLSSLEMKLRFQMTFSHTHTYKKRKIRVKEICDFYRDYWRALSNWFIQFFFSMFSHDCVWERG